MISQRSTRSVHIAIIGGGAAGFFAAITCAESDPDALITILEGTRQPLYKVRISGGGRCNVTHHCFDPAALIKSYPRGGRELLGAFRIFQPRDTVEWFAKHGVTLKSENDGRMFPTSDRSETIIDCLQKHARAAGVDLRIGARVTAVRRSVDTSESSFAIELKNGQTLRADRVLLATGSSPQGYEFAAKLGHTIIPCVPSLFTFAIKDQRLKGLAGVSFPDAKLRLVVAGSKDFTCSGPLLITHWGLSGPAVLKLSAFAARHLFAGRYQAELIVNWIPAHNSDTLLESFHSFRDQHPRKTVAASNLLPLPTRFWERIIAYSGAERDVTWSHITREAMKQIAAQLCEGRYRIIGKGEFKDEFVTCGGVKLSEVDFRTMESRICPGLFFAGEILDIDGITGGYNFQSAWTTGFLAGRGMTT